MSLKDTVEMLRSLLASVTVDLEKAVNGNKAAAQRVRTASIRFEKISKVYRKESIRSEKSDRNRKMARSRSRGIAVKSKATQGVRKGTTKNVPPRRTSRRC